MHRLRTVTSLDVSAVAGHYAMPAALLFSVAIYSHANECSLRFIVFESTMICCEFFFFLNHVYLVLSCHVYAILCFRSGGGVVDNTLDYQSRGRKIDPPLLRSFG